MHPELAGSPPVESHLDERATGALDVEPNGSCPDAEPDASTGPATESPISAAPEAPDHLPRVEAALTAIARQMEMESERAAFRERVIDRLHADVERLRAVERTGVLRPVVTDLCRLRNDLLRQASTLPAEMSVAEVARLLGSFADVVEDALERCGVAVLPTSTGAPFTPGCQQVVETVPVDEPTLDGTVAAVVQDGYFEIDGGKVVLPARVALRRAAPSSTTTTDQTTTKEQPHD
jgi:molecular chaperone GrpE (heat shock protein)